MYTYSYRKALDGLPDYIPGTSIEAAKKKSDRETIIKLGSNENPLGPAVSLTELASLQTSHYPDSTAQDLRRVLSDHHHCSEQNIIVGNGSDEIMQLIALSFLSPEDSCLTADITFSEYAFVTRLMGASMVHVPLHENRYDLNAILDTISASTKIIFIANPNNPTGTLLKENELHAFLKDVPDRILVVLDEAYIEFVDSALSPPSTRWIHQFPNVIVLRTFSKLYGLAAFQVVMA